MCFTQAGGGRNEVDQRFLTLFSVFNMTFPSEESLQKIYFSILDGHLNPFKKEVRSLASKITQCTMELYSSIVRELPPTPSKFHYIFNLRDLSRIYHGLCLTTPDRFEDTSQIVRVWRNECLRVFNDRLINDTDKQLVQVEYTFLDEVVDRRELSLFDHQESIFVVNYFLLFISYKHLI